MRRLTEILIACLLVSLPASGAKLELAQGTTSRILLLFIQDASSNTGVGLQGLVYNTAGLDCRYHRNDAGSASGIALVNATAGTWTSGGFIRSAATESNFPGIYQLGIPDAALAAGAESVILQCRGAADMVPWVQEIQLTGWDPDAGTVDVISISGDTTAADNLELMYDGTGYEDGTAPASRTQLSQIALTGVAVSTPAKDAPNGFAITWGENEANDEDSTHSLDGTTHDIEAQDDTGTEKIDVYYEFSIGGDGVSTGVQAHHYLDKGGGASKNLTAQAYNWGTTSWDTIGTLDSGTSLQTDSYTLFTSHVGTSTNIGLVRIRYLTGSVALSSTTQLLVDQIFVEYAIVSRTVGYEGGAVWIDTGGSNTNTESFVDGTADNPVSTIVAATTIAGNVGLKHFHLLPGSSLTLAQAYDGYEFSGSGSTIALGGQSVSGTTFLNMIITGNDDGSNAIPTDYLFCEMGSSTLGVHSLHACSLSGDIILAEAGDYFWNQCYSAAAGTATPSVDFEAAVETKALSIRHYSGGMEYKNYNAGGGTHTNSIEGHGQIVLNANCAGGSISRRGHFPVTDNAGGAVTVVADVMALASVATETRLAELDAANLPSDVDDILGDTGELQTNQNWDVWDDAARTLTKAGYLDGSVWIDTNGANAGTTTYEDGTADNPVNTLADATTIAVALGIKRFSVQSGSTITLAQSYDSYTFYARSATIALGGQSISGTVFIGSKITGDDDGSTMPRSRFVDCDISSSTLGQFVMLRSRLTGTLTLAEAGSYFMEGSYSGVAGTATPTLDFGAGLAASNVNMRHYSGGIEIENMGAGAGAYNMSLEGHGQLVINVNCSATSTIAIRGHFTVTDSTDGAVTLSDNARIDTTQVAAATWDALLTGYNTVGTFGQLHQSPRTGTAQAGAAGTITLDALASSVDDAYNGALVFLTGGAGLLQAPHLIIDYVGSTKVATVWPNWVTNPDATSVFVLLPAGGYR